MATKALPPPPPPLPPPPPPPPPRRRLMTSVTIRYAPKPRPKPRQKPSKRPTCAAVPTPRPQCARGRRHVVDDSKVHLCRPRSLLVRCSSQTMITLHEVTADCLVFSYRPTLAHCIHAAHSSVGRAADCTGLRPAPSPSPYFVPVLPRVMLIELRQILISYQYYRMLLLNLSGRV